MALPLLLCVLAGLAVVVLMILACDKRASEDECAEEQTQEEELPASKADRSESDTYRAKALSEKSGPPEQEQHGPQLPDPPVPADEPLEKLVVPLWHGDAPCKPTQLRQSGGARARKQVPKTSSDSE